MSEKPTQGYVHRFCQDCGFEHGGNANFCPRCGAAQAMRVHSAERPPTSQPNTEASSQPPTDAPFASPPPPNSQTTPHTVSPPIRQWGPLRVILLSLIMLLGIVTFIFFGEGYFSYAIIFALVTGGVLWIYRALTH